METIFALSKKIETGSSQPFEVIWGEVNIPDSYKSLLKDVGIHDQLFTNEEICAGDLVRILAKGLALLILNEALYTPFDNTNNKQVSDYGAYVDLLKKLAFMLDLYLDHPRAYVTKVDRDDVELRIDAIVRRSY